jgi:hypothetical protein
MCGRSNEAVPRGGFSLFDSSFANIHHIPSAIFAAGAVAQPDKQSTEEHNHRGPPE